MDERVGKQPITVKSLQESIRKLKRENEDMLERMEALEADLSTAYASMELKHGLLLKAHRALQQEFLASQNRHLLRKLLNSGLKR